MTKKTRLIILAVCAILFLIITPYIILYSLGYRVNFKTLKIAATGGIYVKALPQGSNIIIDNKIDNTTGIFSQAVFVQNLLPKQHSVSVKKDGYYDYQKTLNVQEKSVTKLEHVLLFKKDMGFTLVIDPTKSPFNQPAVKDLYVIKNNNLYVAVLPTVPATLVIKNVVAYKVSDNNIIWLGLDGFLYSSDLQGQNPQKLSSIALQINKKNTYEILVFSKNIFLKENVGVSLFNTDTKLFDAFYLPVNAMKSSPNGQKILYFNDHQLFISSLTSDNPDLPKLTGGILLQKSTDKITDAFWLNEDYIVLSLGDNIIISETDIRNNINSIQLPKTLQLTDGGLIDMASPKISFNQQDKKLYILTGNNLLSSERLVP